MHARQALRKKPSTAQIHQAWLNLGKPTITASVCRDIAASVYRDEWAGTDKTDVARNKLVDRVRGVLETQHQLGLNVSSVGLNVSSELSAPL